MSLYLANDREILGQCASNTGYGDLLRAVEAAGGFPHLDKFLETGLTEDVAEVVSELERFSSDTAGKQNDVSDTALGMIALMRGEKVVVVTQGFVPELAGSEAGKVARGRDLEKYSYGSVQVDIDPASRAAAHLQRMQRALCLPANLAGKGLEAELHITVRYGIQDGDVGELRGFLSSLAPFDIQFGPVASFPPTPNSDNAAVLIVAIISPDIEAINAELPNHANYKAADFDYHPHLTLAYVKPEAVDQILTLASAFMPGEEMGGVLVSALTISPREGEPEVVPLIGSVKLAGKIRKAAGGWIGVDFDGTLAEQTGDPAIIGGPTPMVERVKQWLAAGEDVRIFTARVDGTQSDPAAQRALIGEWCIEHIGQALPVTNQKDQYMVELWDDRAVRVGRNTGEPLSPHEKLRKRAKLLASSRRTPLAIQSQAKLQRHVADFLKQTGHQLAAKLRNYSKAVGAMGLVAKASFPQDPDDILRELLPIDWADLVPRVEVEIGDVATEASTAGLAQLNMTGGDMIASANDIAADWASDRAAELVGMKYDDDGNLIENPNPKWAISESTRDDIRDMVTRAFKQETPLSELADKLESSFTFSEDRAANIAKTEIQIAQNQGNLAGWTASGVVDLVDWLLSEDHDDASECDCTDNSDGSPYPIAEVPWCPAHSACECVLAAHLGDDGDEDE